MSGDTELRANGKLLLAGEYLVLVGAKALALPVKFGQRMIYRKSAGRTIEWSSTSLNLTWFNATFDAITLDVIATNKKTVAARLKKLLLAARKLNPRFLSGKTGWKVQVAANYPLAWGLGSSATLQFLVARWANIPEFEFFRMISQGSGYDIVCAGQSGLLHFQLRKGCPEITPAVAGPALRNHTYYVPLGKKQQSKKEVSAFLESMNFSEIDLVAVSQLSEAICEAASPEELIRLVNEHEYILSTILKREPLVLRYPTFPGTAKSLGAWGGDFAMFVSSAEPKDVIKILRSSGFSKVFSYSDLEIKA